MNKRATPEHLKPFEAARIAKWRAENPQRHLEVSREAASKLYDKRREEKYLSRLRDEFAMAALPAILVQPADSIPNANHKTVGEAISGQVYKIADAMIAQRGK